MGECVKARVGCRGGVCSFFDVVCYAVERFDEEDGEEFVAVFHVPIQRRRGDAHGSRDFAE